MLDDKRLRSRHLKVQVIHSAPNDHCAVLATDAAQFYFIDARVAATFVERFVHAKPPHGSASVDGHRPSSFQTVFSQALELSGHSKSCSRTVLVMALSASARGTHDRPSGVQPAAWHPDM